MTKRLRFEPEAEDELRAAARWYEAQRPGLGTEFLAEVDEAVARLREAPGAAGPAPAVPDEIGARRVLVHRFPYALVFLDLSEEFDVVAVAHGRRRPGYWRGRIRGG